MNGEEREGRETPRQDCLCCACEEERERERTQQIYVLQEVSQICGVTDQPPQANMLWLLINSWFQFLDVLTIYACICCPL